MASETTNYGFHMPESDGSESMAEFEVFLTGNLEAIEAAATPDVIAAPPLPQSGYNPGDIVYLADSAYQSCFILMSNNADWGYIWRPIQAAISPWYDIPSTAIMHADYELHPSHPLQVALDNKGDCYWRGAIRKTTLGLPNNDSELIFETLPFGLCHHTSGMFTVAIDPATPQTDTGFTAYKGGRLYIQNDGYSSFRFHNASSAQDIYLDGIEYPVSLEAFFGV